MSAVSPSSNCFFTIGDSVITSTAGMRPDEVARRTRRCDVTQSKEAESCWHTCFLRCCGKLFTIRSTVAAAESLGLSCVGVERHREYFDLSLEAIPKLALIHPLQRELF